MQYGIASLLYVVNLPIPTAGIQGGYPDSSIASCPPSGSSQGAMKDNGCIFLCKWDHSCFTCGSLASLMGQCVESESEVDIDVRGVVLCLCYKLLKSIVNMTSKLIVYISRILWVRLHLWLSSIFFKRKIATFERIIVSQCSQAV